MRWYIFLLLFLNSMYASLIKKENLPEVTPDIVLFKESGETDIEKLVSVKEGQTVAFKTKEKVFVGVVEKYLVEKQTLRIIGSFPNYKESRFVFEFKKLEDKQVQIIGILVFPDRFKYYSLELDKETKVLYFEEKNLEKELLEEKINENKR